MAREKKRIINFLLSEYGHAWFTDLSTEFGTTKTAVFRAMLATARKHEAEVRATLKEQR